MNDAASGTNASQNTAPDSSPPSKHATTTRAPSNSPMNAGTTTWGGPPARSQNGKARLTTHIAAKTPTTVTGAPGLWWTTWSAAKKAALAATKSENTTNSWFRRCTAQSGLGTGRNHPIRSTNRGAHGWEPGHGSEGGMDESRGRKSRRGRPAGIDTSAPERNEPSQEAAHGPPWPAPEPTRARPRGYTHMSCPLACAARRRPHARSRWGHGIGANGGIRRAGREELVTGTGAARARTAPDPKTDPPPAAGRTTDARPARLRPEGRLQRRAPTGRRRPPARMRPAGPDRFMGDSPTGTPDRRGVR